jgi:hypothetical protein
LLIENVINFIFRFSRALIATQACNYGIAGCTTEAVTMISNWMADPENYK